MVSWFSASTSSRKASNGSSARSSSSISSTGERSWVSASQQRPLDQHLARVEALAEALARRRVGDAVRRLGQPDLHHLPRHVPFVGGLGDVEALVALDAAAATRSSTLGQRLGQLGLADTRLALEEQRPAQRQRQEDGGAEPAVGEVAGVREPADDGVDGAARQAMWTWTVSC